VWRSLVTAARSARPSVVVAGVNWKASRPKRGMTERVPPTPRPKLMLLSSEEGTVRGEPVPEPQMRAPEPGLAGAASNPDDALRLRAERNEDPLGVAMTW